MPSARIIADTSIWVDHLNKGDVELARLLRRRSVAMHPMIIGETALGSLADRRTALHELGQLLQATVAGHQEVMLLIEQHGLFSRGIGYVDAHLSTVTRRDAGRLWTRDKRLHTQAERLGLAYA